MRETISTYNNLASVSHSSDGYPNTITYEEVIKADWSTYEKVSEKPYVCLSGRRQAIDTHRLHRRAVEEVSMCRNEMQNVVTYLQQQREKLINCMHKFQMKKMKKSGNISESDTVSESPVVSESDNTNISETDSVSESDTISESSVVCESDNTPSLYSRGVLCLVLQKLLKIDNELNNARFTFGNILDIPKSNDILAVVDEEQNIDANAESDSLSDSDSDLDIDDVGDDDISRYADV
jgi:FtsZ-binding cell division protein ZapB